MVTKRIKIVLAIFIMVAAPSLSVVTPVGSAKALTGSDFNAGRIIDDSVFYNKSTMTPQQISAFLVSRVPECKSSSPGCLRDYMLNIKERLPDQYCTGRRIDAGYKIAAQVIWDVAQACNVNPQSLLVLLQKEQGLVSSTSPTTSMYTKATGFACPDTAACDTEYSGLYNQLYYAARQFQRYAKLPNNYSHRANTNNRIYYHPGPCTQYNSSGVCVARNPDACGSSTVFIQTQATAGLYNYTPYQPNQPSLDNLYGTSSDSCSSYGNRNFWRLFTDWFGSTTDGKCYYGSVSTDRSSVHLKKYNQTSKGVLVLNSNTGSGCTEFHGWNTGFKSWQYHTPSNLPTYNASQNEVKFADLDGDGSDETILVGFSGTGSGKIEFHIWNPSLKSWRSHIASNSAIINPGISSIEFADLNGDGKDEGILIGQGNGSTSTGKIEFHIWNPGFGTWKEHIISNSSTLDPGISSIEFADLNGDGKDEGILIGQGNGSTSTGKIEFHIWNPGFGTWKEHIISNSSTLDPRVSTVLFGDLDNNGKDEGVLTGRIAPTGSGKIEFHIWNPGLTSWKDHIISNQTAPSS